MGSARRILVIGPEDELAPELEDALERSDLDRVLTRYEPDFRRALLALRRFRPDLILLPLGARRQFDHFLREIARLAPGVRLAAVVGAPGATDVIRAARSGIDEFLERPLRASDIVRIVLRSPGASRPAAAGGTIACVASNKGGVGRTTVAVDLACRLARAHADRVLLVDASPQVGGCALALDLQDASTVADALREEDRLDPVMLRELATPHACGLRVLGSPRESGAPEIDGDALFRLLTVARRAFDCVVVDTSPLLDPVSLAVLDVSDLVYVVTNATRPGVLGVERYLRTLDRLGIGSETVRIVLNRSHPPFQGELTARAVAETLGRPVAHEIPFDARQYTGINLGEPVALGSALEAGIEWVRARPPEPPRPTEPASDLGDVYLLASESGRIESADSARLPAEDVPEEET